MASWEEIKGNLYAVGRDVGQKAKEVSEVAKLKMDIRTKQDFVEKQFASLGRAYYEANKENAVGEEIAQFTVIEEALLEIERMKQQVLDIQGAAECPGCGKKVPTDTTFCSDCGTKINDVFEEE